MAARSQERPKGSQYYPDEALRAHWDGGRCGVCGMAATVSSIRGRGYAWATSRTLLARGRSTDRDEAWNSVGASSSHNRERCREAAAPRG